MWETLIITSHMHPNLGSNLQPRLLPLPGIESTTFWCTRQHSNQMSYPARAMLALMKSGKSWKDVIGQRQWEIKIIIWNAVNRGKLSNISLFRFPSVSLIFEVKFSFPPGIGKAPLVKALWPVAGESRKSFLPLSLLKFLHLQMPSCQILG